MLGPRDLLAVARGLDHGRMKQVFGALDKPDLGRREREALRCRVVSQSARDFANAFEAMQKLRHSADYDPHAVLRPVDAADTCNAAALALDAPGRIAEGEFADIATLLLVNPRT